MKKIPLYDHVAQYAYVIESQEDFKLLEAIDEELKDIVLFVFRKTEECSDKLSLKYKNSIFVTEDELQLYLKPNLPTWLKNDDTFSLILNQDYLSVLPFSAEIMPSLNCMFRCDQCTYRPAKEIEGLWDERKINSSSKYHMTPQTIKIIINQLKSCGVNNVTFTGGGEPLINPETTLLGMRLCHDYNINFGLYTNAINLQGYLLEEICKLNPLFIRISVYGFNARDFANYTHIPQEYFYKIIKNIKSIISYKSKKGCNFNLSLSFLIHPLLMPNIEEIDCFFNNYFSSDELKNIFVVRFAPAVDYHTNIQHDKEYLESVYNYAQYYSSKMKKVLNVMPYRHRLNDLYSIKAYDECRGSGFFLEIGPDANVYICCEKIFQNEFLIGNLLTQTVEEIYTGEARRIILDRLKSENCKKCPNVCKPHETNKQMSIISSLISAGQKESIIKWREDLKNISIIDHYYPGRFNGFES